ncbi:hypothetical protein [Amycolatopsis suaedae]|uniref:ARB-07466-like C-terminal domain-containing protein n=1 Tax=Amycolatopsis suaedae TaxID=2510978 RepID=A0A4Q7JAC0_9PSEU|nr:hypothetical protein [Amycolatopsis suaedae]RZQ63862.1 hypothetical protein EWH70_11940 [Amycolatopsis suaedae]
MAGRHRKKVESSWKRPTGIGAGVAVVLASSVWLTSGAWQTTETTGAALAMAPPPAPPPPPSTTTPPPSTTTPPPSSTTTTTTPPKPTTTTTTPPAEACSSTLDGTKPHVAQVGNHIKAKFGVDDIGGRAGRSGASDHPDGLALDFMVDTKTGNEIADYLLANRKAFGITYVIWRQRYNDGSGWSMMEDRGGATANHFDHVHVSFRSGAKVSVTC